MLERRFNKCLKTLLRTGPAPDDQKTFVIPYEGNLTAPKFETLADKFAQVIAPFYTNKHGVTFEHVREQALKRLKSEWYTGREKNVTLCQSSTTGNYKLEGGGWWMSNYPRDHFVIVE